MYETDDAAAATEFFVHRVSGASVEQAVAKAIGLHPGRLAALESLLEDGRRALSIAQAFQSENSATPSPPTQQGQNSTAHGAARSDQRRAQPAGEADDGNGTHRVLSGLKDYRDIRHVGEELIKRGITPAPRAVPRWKSRGNALLYLLSTVGKRQGLTTDELVYAFQRMGILLPDDEDPRRKVTWELKELGRKGWPVEKEGATWRLTIQGGGP